MPPIRPQQRGWHELQQKAIGTRFKPTLACIALRLRIFLLFLPIHRRTPEYRTTILSALQLADPAAAATRYPDLGPADLAALRETVIRCAAAFWVEGTPRTTVRHMAHDTIPTGPPVRTPPHRLSGTDAQWIEDQIIKGSATWSIRARHERMGIAPIPQPKRVSLRTSVCANDVWSLITVACQCPHTPRVVLRAAGGRHQSRSRRIHVVYILDACAGFNQIANTDRARRMLAILARSGQYLPRCLTFGPPQRS